MILKTVHISERCGLDVLEILRLLEVKAKRKVRDEHIRRLVIRLWKHKNAQQKFKQMCPSLPEWPMSRSYYLKP